MTPTTGYCDDGNTTPGDGCDATCGVETGWTCTSGSSTTSSTCSDDCGDGLIKPASSSGTYCDDGNTSNNDGCSSTCSVESKWE